MESAKSDERAQNFAFGLIELLNSSKIISARDIRRGFDRVYRNLHTLAIDSTDPVEAILEHLEACISQELLPSDCIMRVPIKFFEAGKGLVIFSAVEEGVLCPLLSEISKAKDQINSLVDEFFASESNEDLNEYLTKDSNGFYTMLLIRKIIERALDRAGHEKELASIFLSQVRASHEQFICAFDDLLWNVPELGVDVPGADRFIGIFIARAVIDDRLPVSFIKEAEIFSQSEIVTLTTANSLLKFQNAPEFIQSQWENHTTDISELKSNIKEIVQEFFDSQEK